MDREDDAFVVSNDYTKVMGEIEKLKVEVNAELLKFNTELIRLRQDLIDIAGIVKRNIDIDIKNFQEELKCY